MVLLVMHMEHVTLLCIEFKITTKRQTPTEIVANSEWVEDVEETVALIKEKLGDELDFIELDEAWKQF